MKNDMFYQMTHECYVFTPRFSRITLINILSVLRSHADEEMYQRKFADLYSKYQKTNFLVNKLSKQDMQNIIDAYIRVLKELEEEEKINDIQKSKSRSKSKD